MFEFDNVEFEFEEEVFFEIVKKVIECKIGVCGFCFIIEGIMFDVMFELFFCDDIEKCVIIGVIVIYGELFCFLLKDGIEVS